MKNEVNKNFKKQFKLLFIKSLKLGFNVKEIKKQLKKQSYSSELIDKLVDEIKSDKEVINLLKEEPKTPNFLETLKNKLFKLSESGKIHKITNIYSHYYNIIIDEKKKLNEKRSDLEDIFDNPENQKLVLFFVKKQETWINTLQKKINKLLRLAKSLVNIELKQETKDKINKILEHVQLKNTKFEKELEIIKKIKSLLSSPDEVKDIAEEEMRKLKKAEISLQKTINNISKRSAKFKEIISQV